MFNSYLRLVPWRNREEWMKVYEDAYSSDSARQSKACDTMEIWLAKRNDVPPGVECTLNILSALKQGDQQNPRQLQLILSTAVLRVVNMLCDNARISGKETIFSIAKLYNLPDWIVNLRHDVSHGTSLPDFKTLERAGIFLLEWLREYYWEVEKQDLNDIVLKRSREEACRENVTFYIVTYIELKNTFKLHGNLRVRELPREIIFRVLDINNKRGYECAKECLPWIIHSEETFADEITKDKNIEIKVFTKKMLVQLLDYFKKLSLWQFDSLHVLADFMKDNYNQLEQDSKETWEEMIMLLNKHCLLDRLLKIFSNNLQNKASSFWFDEISKCILKKYWADKLKCHLSIGVTLSNDTQEQALVHSIMLKKRLGISDDCLKKDVDVRLFTKIEKKFSDLKKAIRLNSSVQYIVDSCSITSVIKTLVLNPNNQTVSLLNTLFPLVKPQFHPTKREELINLVLIRLGQKTLHRINSYDNFEIKTLHDLQRLEEESSNRTKSNQNNNDNEEMEISDDSDSMDGFKNNCNYERSNWDFTNCPLGVTPWDKEGLEYYHKPHNPKTAVISYIFPISIPTMY